MLYTDTYNNLGFYYDYNDNNFFDINVNKVKAILYIWDSPDMLFKNFLTISPNRQQHLNDFAIVSLICCPAFSSLPSISIYLEP